MSLIANSASMMQMHRVTGAIFCRCDGGHVECVRMLLENRAMVNDADSFNKVVHPDPPTPPPSGFTSLQQPNTI